MKIWQKPCWIQVFVWRSGDKTLGRWHLANFAKHLLWKYTTLKNTAGQSATLQSTFSSCVIAGTFMCRTDGTMDMKLHRIWMRLDPLWKAHCKSMLNVQRSNDEDTKWSHVFSSWARVEPCAHIAIICHLQFSGHLYNTGPKKHNKNMKITSLVIF